VKRFKEIVSREAGVGVPEDPYGQLELAIGGQCRGFDILSKSTCTPA